jgi:predicted nucleotidyltransferase
MRHDKKIRFDETTKSLWGKNNYPIVAKYICGSRLWECENDDSDYDWTIIFQIPTVEVLKGVRILNTGREKIQKTEAMFNDWWHFEIGGFLRRLAIGNDPHFAEIILNDRLIRTSDIWEKHKHHIQNIAFKSLQNKTWINRQLKWADYKIKEWCRSISYDGVKNLLFTYRSLLMLKIFNEEQKIVSIPHKLISLGYASPTFERLVDIKINKQTTISRELINDTIEELQEFIKYFKKVVPNYKEILELKEEIKKIEEDFRLVDFRSHLLRKSKHLS